MKLILILVTFWSTYALAQETCSTSWLYKPYQSCRNVSHGLDVPASGRGEFVREDYILSPVYNGGQDQTVVCAAAQEKFNREQMQNQLQASLIIPLGEKYAMPNPALEQHKEANPVAKDKKNRKDTYRYACKAEIYKFPFAMRQSKACGLADDKLSVIRVQKRPSDLTGELQCLTCDGLENAPNKGYVACLQRSIQALNNNVYSINNINIILNPDLADIDALVARIRNLLSVNNSLATKDQLSTGEVLTFNEFVTVRSKK